MTTAQISVNELVPGLDNAPGWYAALAVFADNIDRFGLRGTWLRQYEPGTSRYPFAFSSKIYQLEFFPTHGVAWLSRLPSRDNGPRITSGRAEARCFLSDFNRAVDVAKALKGDHAGFCPLLGLLVGAPLDGTLPDSPRRVFTMQFDPNWNRWEAYDGDLVRWMKRHLLAPAPCSASS